MKEKEEFSRVDPDKTHKVYWFTIFNWLIPALCVLVGLFITTQNFAALMNYDSSVIGKPLYTLTSGYRIYNPLVFLLGMIKFAFNDVYSYYFFQAAPPAFIGIALAIFTFFLTGILCNLHQKNMHIHGTARWATQKDLQKSGLLQQYGVVCGELNSAPVTYEIGGEKKDKLVLHLKNSFWRKYIARKPPKVPPLICHAGTTNTWMIAPTRSGKGVSTIIPTCLNYGIPYKDWTYNTKSFFYKALGGAFKFLCKETQVIKNKGSMIIFDPKGENYEASAGWRAGFSTVLPFNPMQINDSKGNPIGTIHYNPILEIPDSRKEAFAWADMFGEFFFDQNSNGDNAFFYKNARDIFTATIMHVRFSDSIPREQKTFTKVLEIFSSATPTNTEENPQEEMGPGSAMLTELRESTHVHDDNSEFPEIHKLIVLAANRSETMTAKERASVYSTVFSELNNFQDPLIEECTSYSDFSVHDFIESKNGISLYLIIPYNHIKRISPLFRLLINFVIRNFSAGATNANSQKLTIPCLFVLDEFPVLGQFPEIEQNAGVLAGYGVTFFIVSQSLSQIIKLYGEHHAFLDHCKTIILYAPGKFSDAKEFSETIGNRSVLLDNISASGTKYEAGFKNVSRSSQETSVSLINPDELMKLEFNRAIIMNQGMPPYKAKKVVYYEDPRFKNIMFMKLPNMNQIMEKAKRLPSNKKLYKMNNVRKESIKAKIEEIECVEVKRMIPSNIDIFSEEVV